MFPFSSFSGISEEKVYKSLASGDFNYLIGIVKRGNNGRSKDKN